VAASGSETVPELIEESSFVAGTGSGLSILLVVELTFAFGLRAWCRDPLASSAATAVAAEGVPACSQGLTFP
jgi:hypothetical protein